MIKSGLENLQQESQLPTTILSNDKDHSFPGQIVLNTDAAPAVHPRTITRHLGLFVAHCGPEGKSLCDQILHNKEALWKDHADEIIELGSFDKSRGGVFSIDFGINGGQSWGYTTDGVGLGLLSGKIQQKMTKLVREKIAVLCYLLHHCFLPDDNDVCSLPW